jgi:hypothetical protein
MKAPKINLTTMKTKTKTDLDKFRADVQKLLVKYPNIRILGDMHGNAAAYDIKATNKNIILQ